MIAEKSTAELMDVSVRTVIMRLISRLFGLNALFVFRFLFEKERKIR